MSEKLKLKEKLKKEFPRLYYRSSRCALAAAIMAVGLSIGAPALAGNWTVDERSGVGSCYKGTNYNSSQKYCHNCTSAGGDNVRWTFTLKCDGRTTRSEPAVHLSCRGAGDESAQHRALAALAKQKLPPASQACPK